MMVRKGCKLRVMAKMLAATVMVTVMLLLAVGPAAAAAPVILLNADGIWSNACGGNGCGIGNVTCLDYDNTPVTTDENQVRYGDDTPAAPCPANENKSGFGFNGESNVEITPGQVFKLGTFTHYNRPIYTYAGNFKHADLNISMNFEVVASGDTFTGTSLYTMNLDETPNQVPCTYTDPPAPNNPPCGDKVWYTGTPEPQVFEIDGVWYTLEIVGFVPNCVGDTIQTEYYTRESAENTACLYGKISVAAPSIKVTKTADPVSMDEPGGSFTFNVEVCNTGDRDLTLTSLIDDKYGDIATVQGKITETTCDDDINGLIPKDGCIDCYFIVDEQPHPEGWTQTDTVTATAIDTENHEVQDSDDATISITGHPDNVPTITQWGIFGMISVITVAAVFMLRRKYAPKVG